MENQSQRTAISRKKLAAPMKHLVGEIEKVNEVLDYGCGKGFDADQLGMDKFDPYFFPEKPTKQYDLIICNYVLCVVEEKDQQAILDDINSLLKVGGVAFITVRRDKKNLNGWTKRNTFQRFVKLNMEIFHEVSNRYCIYQTVKG